MDTLPAPRPRPRFAHLLFRSDVDYRGAAEALGCSHETVRLICLPFADERRRVPSKRLMERIVEWTRGETVPGDFYEPISRAIAA